MEGESEQVKPCSGEKHWEKLSVYAIEVFHIKKRLNDTKDRKEGRANRRNT